MGGKTWEFESDEKSMGVFHYIGNRVSTGSRIDFFSPDGDYGRMLKDALRIELYFEPEPAKALFNVLASHFDRKWKRKGTVCQESESGSWVAGNELSLVSFDPKGKSLLIQSYTDTWREEISLVLQPETPLDSMHKCIDTVLYLHG